MANYNRQVWFGTKSFMQWIPAPAVDVSAGKQGFANAAQFTNGGAWVRRSKASAKRYTLSWNMKSRDEVRPILDYADGLYGDGFIYYVDPFAMDNNVLPAYLAAPYINGYDGPFTVDDARPAIINNGTSVNGYPVESAQYKVTSTSKVYSVFIPIPPDHTIHIGAHGALQSGNASVTVAPVFNPTSTGAPGNLTLLARNSTTRTNYALPANNGYMGVEISLRSTSTGIIQLDGIVAQILPDGAVMSSGGFISGQGSSGMSFASQPSYSEYSAALDRVGASVELVETEAWSWS